MKGLLEILFNAVMKLEREEAFRARSYERSEKRLGYSNGYKDKTFQTRVGQLDLKVPQTRGIAFYPRCVEKGCRSERALKVAIA